MTRPARTEVAIRYQRVGRETVVYRQELIAEVESSGSPGVPTLVTLQPATPIEQPKILDGTTILEPGSPVVWFTFPGLWHDIGAFYRVDGTFTGLYANILTPVELGERPVAGAVGSAAGSAQGEGTDCWKWETTDLMLDVWLARDSDTPVVLDREEFQAERHALAPVLVQGAEKELARLVAARQNDEWPPPVVGEWPLTRVLERAEGDQASSSSTTHAPQSRSRSR